MSEQSRFFVPCERCAMRGCLMCGGRGYFDGAVYETAEPDDVERELAEGYLRPVR